MSAKMIIAFMLLTLGLSCKAFTIGENDSTALSLNPTAYGNYGELQGRLIPIPIPAGLFGNKNNQAATNNAAIAAIEKQLAEMNARINALTLRADNIKRVYDKTKPQLDRYAAFDQRLQNFNQRLKQNGQTIQSVAQQTYQQAQRANTKRCLATPITISAKFIAAYQKCFSLELSPLTYDNAQIKCKKQGGILAEPLYTDTAFYQNLINAFTAAKMAQIGTTGLYVGMYVDSNGRSKYYKYNSDSLFIPPMDPIWESALPNPLLGGEKAFIPTPPSTPTNWKLHGNDNGQTVRDFVCQYPVW